MACLRNASGWMLESFSLSESFELFSLEKRWMRTSWIMASYNMLVSCVNCRCMIGNSHLLVMNSLRPVRLVLKSADESVEAVLF